MKVQYLTLAIHSTPVQCQSQFHRGPSHQKVHQKALWDTFQSHYIYSPLGSISLVL